MADVQAFRGWRYDGQRVGDLSAVVAPPYDVISPAGQQALYERHPCNVVRLILNRPTDADTDQDNGYTRAAATLDEWKTDATLVREPEPALYLCQQTFTVDDQTHVRRGFMAAVRLEELGQGQIYAHEQTRSRPKEDRLRLTRATRMNLSPVFGLYPDPQGRVMGSLRAGVGRTPFVAEDDAGVRSDLWPITNAGRIAHVSERLAGTPVFIADGHHRYETACTYRRELAEAGLLTGPDHPANFVLMMLVPMCDPGLAILPCHRLVGGLGELTHPQLCEALGAYFDCEQAGQGVGSAGAVWSRLQAEGRSSTLGLYTVADQTWTLARLKTPAAMSEVAPDHSEAWRLLGVSVLHSLVLDHVLMPRFGQGAGPELAVVPSLGEMTEELGTGQYQLGALVLPASMDDVQTIASALETMPAKTTYFYPKVLSGLVLHDLSGEGP